MHPKQLDPRQCLYLASLLILVVGLCTAVILYVTMDDSEAAEDTYRVIIYSGKSYPVPVDSDRLYLQNLERFGGKAAVLFAQFNRWFISLWRGRALAVTVLWIYDHCIRRGVRPRKIHPGARARRGSAPRRVAGPLDALKSVLPPPQLMRTLPSQEQHTNRMNKMDRIKIAVKPSCASCLSCLIFDLCQRSPVFSR